MKPIEHAPDKVTVFYHADCLDGFGAAYSAWHRFGNAARYIPIHYGERWGADDVIGRHIYVLDFSFKVPELISIAELAASVEQLDHHASARDDWQAKLTLDVTSGMSRFTDTTRHLTVAFDLNKSGARIAWEHFHPSTPLPLPIAHIEDIDLWRFEIDGTRPFCRALRMRPFDFDAWHEIISEARSPDSPDYQKLLTEGEAIERFCTIEVDRLVTSSLVMPVTLRGDGTLPAIDGLAVNANAVFTSELGGRLAHQCGTFGLIWQLARDGQVKASLRGCGKVNLGQLAGQYGGGGHPNAAGFVMPVTEFLTEVLAR